MKNPQRVRHVGRNTDAVAPPQETNVEAQLPAEPAAYIPPNRTADEAAAPSARARQAADLAYAHQLEREHVQPNGGHAKHEKGKKKMGKVKKAILILLLALLAVFAFVIGKYIYDINHPATLFPGAVTTPTPSPTPTSTPSQNAAATPKSEPTPSPTLSPEEILRGQADLGFMKNRVNILVLGLDESLERAHWGSYRTDTMILLTINFDTKDVDMVSIPRDSYVKIANSDGKPIGETGKVNSAFPKGGGAQKNGFGYAMGTVSYLLGGIPVEYYVGFNMNVVKEVVDAMGGVYYEVDIEVKMNGRELHPGMQFMDGQAVLDYCRQRKGSSDIARVDRQQRMLTAIFKQLKSTGKIANIPSIYKAAEQNIQTNLSFTQISALAYLAMQMEMDQLGRHTLDGEFLDVNNTSYWGLRTSSISSMVKEVFGASVSIDAEVSASNVRAQIAAMRALVAGELTSAEDAVKTADYIFGSFNDWLTGSTRQQLEEAKSRVEDAIDSAIKEELDYYTPKLVSINNQIIALLQQHGAIPGGSQNSSAQTQAGPQTPSFEDDIPEEPLG